MPLYLSARFVFKAFAFKCVTIVVICTPSKATCYERRRWEAERLAVGELIQQSMSWFHLMNKILEYYSNRVRDVSVVLFLEKCSRWKSRRKKTSKSRKFTGCALGSLESQIRDREVHAWRVDHYAIRPDSGSRCKHSARQPKTAPGLNEKLKRRACLYDTAPGLFCPVNSPLASCSPMSKTRGRIISNIWPFLLIDLILKEFHSW